MKIKELIRPKTVDEAYHLLQSNHKSKLLAGGLFLRLQKSEIPLVIDLSLLDLSYIKDHENGYEIGAMTSLRTLEKSDLPQGIIEAVGQISGVGVRNLATIGGSICGRYPFSDINVALQAMKAVLHFHHRGHMAIDDFLNKGLKEKDILLSVIIPKVGKSSTKYFKKVYTDFSVVNISYADNCLVIGARPGRGIAIEGPIHLDDLMTIPFASDYRASGEYRQALARALVEDLLNELEVPYGS